MLRIPPDYQIPPRYLLEADFDASPPVRTLFRLQDRQSVPVLFDEHALMTDELLDEQFNALTDNGQEKHN